MAQARRKSAVHEPDYQYLIRRIKEAREEAGLTQVQVATALARPMSFVSKCEKGERRIDPIDLAKFAAIYDKPFEYFLPVRQKPKSRKKRAS
jgi:transcriptional regulator with XRE-family HTH domain